MFSVLNVGFVSHIRLPLWLKICKSRPASSLAARRQVRWYGHAHRLPPHHPSRAILDFDDLDQLGLDPAAIEPLAQDRDKRRALVNLVGSMHDAPTGAVHETRWWWFVGNSIVNINFVDAKINHHRNSMMIIFDWLRQFVTILSP